MEKLRKTQKKQKTKWKVEKDKNPEEKKALAKVKPFCTLRLISPWFQLRYFVGRKKQCCWRVETCFLKRNFGDVSSTIYFFHMEKNKRKKSKLNKNKLTGEVGFSFDHPTANEISVTSLRCHATCTSKWLRQVNLSFISLWFLFCRFSFETIKWKPYPKLILQNDTF